MFKKIKTFVLDIIFPINCPVCGKEGEWLCRECAMVIPFDNPFKKDNNVRGYLSRLVSFGFYHNPPLRGLITNLKYFNAKAVAPHIEKFILKFLNKYSLEFTGDEIFVPIPLHRNKLWKRGFNQAEVIARIIAKYFNLGLRNDIIKRRWNTEEQTKIDKKERLTNILGAFVCLKSQEIIGRRVVLVDDVYTTGATMQECAKILRENGAKDVVGIVLARG